ncbi:MAG: rhodanese-like domain-containing protein [Actinomycetia bacterium]|nr:rhodanese-like domain-containing protein [Actinomycetes bacterium]
MNQLTAFRGVIRLFLLALAGFALVVAGCSSDDESSGAGSDVPSPGVPAAEQALAQDRTVIDVRTPQEYAVAHVTDADLIDVQDPTFAERIAELDPSGEYVVYCRSGNRSAVAAQSMSEAGLDVWDGGGLTDMEAAGWPSTSG